MGHQEILARIEEKIVRLGKAKEDLQLQISRLKEENESYYRINKELLAQVDELTDKNRELEIHRSLPFASNDENRVVSKQRISELVKEIDECIALLNK